MTSKNAAGIAFVAPDGLALFVRRSAAGDHQGEWCLPGGTQEEGETLEQAARREAFEEAGIQYDGELSEVAGTSIGDGPGVYTTFLARLPEPFTPKINEESSGFAWLPLDAPPQPLHPGLSEGLAGSQVAKDAEFKEGDHPRDQDGKFGSGGGGGSESENAPEGSEQEAQEQRELVQSFYEDSPGDVVDVINGADLDKTVDDKIQSLESAASDHADNIESYEDYVAEITDEDRAGLKEGEVFTAEESLEEEIIEAAGHAVTAREELVEASNSIAAILGGDDIGMPEDYDIDNLTGKEARAVFEAIESINLQNRYSDVDDAKTDLENAMEDEDEDFDNCVAYAKVFKEKATELHEAIKVAIYKIDVATEPARKRTAEEADKAAEAFEKRRDAAGAKDHALAFDRAIFSSAGVEMLRPGLAFDRGTVRSYDVDGRLRIEIANISKANICPYMGSEIPGWEELGLEKSKIYQLFRDPEELAKAAPTFNNLPLLEKHVAVTADDHQPDLVIGATGSDATFVAPYLTNSLVVWAKSAIDGIENDEKKELSSAYHYRADMIPGTYEGIRYDGVMRDILGNHVACVREGRAGTDVVVGDSKEHLKMAVAIKKSKDTVRTILTVGAVAAFLQPRLKKDAGRITFDHALDGLTSTNFSARKVGIIDAVKKATVGKLAHDASVDGLAQVLDMIEGGKGATADADPIADPIPKKDPDKEDDTPGLDADVPNFLKGKLTEDDYKTCMDMMAMGAKDSPLSDQTQLRNIEERKRKEEEDRKARGDSEVEDDKDKGAKDEPPPFKGKPEVGGGKAMDSAAVARAIKVATDSAIKVQRDIRVAETAVRPWVGELTVAFDSAEEVYRHALSMLGVEHKDVHASALKHILDVQTKPGARRNEPHVAMDAAASDDFAKRFPEASRLRQS